MNTYCRVCGQVYSSGGEVSHKCLLSYTATEPRDWWIIPADNVDVGRCFDHEFDKTIHVVEHSAYEQVCKLLDESQRRSRVFEAECDAALAKLNEVDHLIPKALLFEGLIRERNELQSEITNSNKFAQDQENTIAELRAEIAALKIKLEQQGELSVANWQSSVGHHNKLQECIKALERIASDALDSFKCGEIARQVLKKVTK